MKKGFAAIVFLLLTVAARAQDPVFTQYFLIPETLNPGFTGFLEDWHVGILHRTQWPEGTRRIDTDYGFANYVPGENGGIGVTLMSHREKFTGYHMFQLNAAYAYKVQLDNDWYFRPGLEAGYGRKDFSFGGLLLEDQIGSNGTISDGSSDPLYNGLKRSIGFVDISAGFLFNNDDAWLGASMKHINRPEIAFTEKGNVPLEMFLSVHGGYQFNIYNARTMFLPEDTKMLLTANYMRQGEYNRLDIGSALIFEKLTFGATASLNPEGKSANSQLLTSINAFGSLQLDHFIFGYSYDFNTSKMERTRGVYELSVTYQMNLHLKCWGCPNYSLRQ